MCMNGEHHAFRIMVWDVEPIIYLHQTTDKEKVLLPHRNNREEIAMSTQSSLQVQRASVARMTPRYRHRRSTALILWSSVFFFFFVFSQKLRGRVTRNREKKAHGLTENNLTNIVAGDQNINPNGLLFKFLPTVSSASLVSRVNGDEFSTGAMIDHK